MEDSMNPAAGAGGIATGSPPAPASDVTVGSSPTGVQAGSPPAVISWDTAPQQLRDEYRTTKTTLDRWNSLGNYSDISKVHQTYTALSNEANQLGQWLGIGSQEVLDSFANDPAGTVAVLRQMARKAQETGQPPSHQDVQSLVRRGIDEAMKPFHQEREERLDTQAETRFDNAFEPMLKQSFPNGLPDSNKEALSGLAWQLIIDQPELYAALRDRGDTSGIQGAFNQAKQLLLKIVTDWNEHEKKRIQTGNGQQLQQPSTAKPKVQTMDDVLARIADRSIPDDAIFK